jgi:DNA-binding CsgD family transcriptional regulator
MTIGYGITLALAVGLLIAYFLMVKKRELWLSMLYVCVAVVNLGYLLISVANTVTFALIANDVAYLGSVFLSMCMLLTIVRLCGFEVRKKHVIVCTSLGVLMLAVIVSSPMLPLYYKRVWLEEIGTAVKLKKEYGVLHNAYLLYLLGYFAAMIATILHSVRRKKMGDPKLAGFISGVVCGNIMVWLFEKFINWEFEFLSVTYLASELLLLLVYWMMQDYVHKNDLPSTQIPTGDTERARELAREKGLTAKECEVLEMMLLGESRKQIAAELHVSENTVKTHVKHIYEKLGVGGREEIQALLS